MLLSFVCCIPGVFGRGWSPFCFEYHQRAMYSPVESSGAFGFYRTQMMKYFDVLEAPVKRGDGEPNQKYENRALFSGLPAAEDLPHEVSTTSWARSVSERTAYHTKPIGVSGIRRETSSSPTFQE